MCCCVFVSGNSLLTVISLVLLSSCWSYSVFRSFVCFYILDTDVTSKAWNKTNLLLDVDVLIVHWFKLLFLCSLNCNWVCFVGFLKDFYWLCMCGDSFVVRSYFKWISLDFWTSLVGYIGCLCIHCCNCWSNLGGLFYLSVLVRACSYVCRLCICFVWKRDCSFFGFFG